MKIRQDVIFDGDSMSSGSERTQLASMTHTVLRRSMKLLASIFAPDSPLQNLN